MRPDSPPQRLPQAPQPEDPDDSPATRALRFDTQTLGGAPRGEECNQNGQ